MTTNERLAASTLVLLRIPSVSRDEDAVLARVRERMQAAAGVRLVDDGVRSSVGGAWTP